MEKGLRRKLLALYGDTFRKRGFFKLVALHHPITPFPIDGHMPTLFIAMMPGDVRDETNEDRQTMFRISLTAILKADNASETLDLLKADAADEIEEALVELRRSSEFQTEFSNILVERVDPTSLSLLPWGIPATQIIPPYGALRVDVANDFHYVGVTA